MAVKVAINGFLIIDTPIINKFKINYKYLRSFIVFP